MEKPTSVSNLSTDAKRRSLELKLKNGPDFIDIVLSIIEKEKLPFTVDTDENGNGVLVDLLSTGQLYLERFITVDEDTIELKTKAKKASETGYDLLVSGATGTGKEIIARSQIGRRTGAFKAINCAGIPEMLLESTLFGHLRGSFTGALGDKKGFIVEAQDGVMFLDEVGELPLLLQAKLLRVIQEKVVCRVGSTTEEPINCRFVCATNRDLQQEVKHGRFREDLYARISMLELHIKPLKERLCDCVPIAKAMKDSEAFLSKYAERLTDGELDLSHNVRSIQQMVTRYNVWGDIK